MHKHMLRSTTVSLSVCAFIVLNACGGTAVSRVVTGVSTIPTLNAPVPYPPYVGTVSQAASFSSESLTSKDVRAACPANEVPIAGGYMFPDPLHLSGQVFASLPDGDGWKVRFWFSGDAAITVFAQCLGSGTGTVSVQIHNVDFPSANANQVVGAGASCPAGSTVLGGGFVVQDGIALVDNYPTTGTTSGWAANFQNLNSSPVLVGATIFATCYSVARPIDIVRDHRITTGGQIINGNLDDEQYYADFQTSCTSGKTLTGGGYTMSLINAGTVVTTAPQGGGWAVKLVRNYAEVNVSGLSAIVECVTL